ncbi:MAG: hypothetical protein ACHQRM_06805 [Bacteroidia bacterium]
MLNRTSSYVILFLALLIGIPPVLQAQNDIGSVSELRKDARKSFEDEDYGTALKLYSRLLSADIKDPDYNYHYGVCLIFASPEKEEAVKYLEKASKDPSVDKTVFFYYGRALQLNYRFNEAISQYGKFKSLVSEKEGKKMQVDHMIETCKNGKNLLKKITDIQVMEKKSLEDKDFFRSYDLGDIGGRLLVKPDEFKTPLDKKKKQESIIFLSPDKTEIFFSSYGSSDENGKDIYVIKRLPNGEYGKPVNLGYPVNTEFDEDFPFLHPNGRVLYFASKGHNSMGGYDIFKSERNAETGVWGKPVNVDFAINSPDDDIMFVTDKDEKTAYFASRRASDQGRIDVYHINLQRRPVDICVFRGKFIPMKDDQGKGAKITVKNADVNEVEAVVRASETDGYYTLNLPNGGKFLMTVETPEGDIQSDMLIVTPQTETVPVRQEITYTDGKMRVNSFYGQPLPDDDNFSLAMDLIRDKARLDVNMSKEQPVATSEKTDSIPKMDSVAVTEKQGHKNLTNDDLIKIAEQDALDLEKDARESRTTADKALVLVNEKNEKAQELNKKVQEATGSADAATDPAQKQIEQNRADALQIQANTAENEAVAANSFYRSLDADAEKKKKESELSTQYARDFAAAIRSKSPDAMKKLDARKEELDKMAVEKSGAEDVEASIRKEAETKQKEVDKVRNESVKLKEDIAGIAKEITNLEREGRETQNEQLKTGINTQINSLQEESKGKEKELTNNDLTLGKLQKEAENLNNQAFLVHQLNEKIKSGTVAVSDGSIDKEKLNAQISSYHPKVQASNDKLTDIDTTGGKRTVVADVPGKTAVTDGVPEKKETIASVSTDKSGTESPLSATSIDTKYAGALNEAETKTTEAEKEKARADTYKAWSEELNTALEVKNSELGKTTDPGRKTKLEADIAALSKDKQEKAELAAASATKAEKLVKETTGVAVTPEKKEEPPVKTPVNVTKNDSAPVAIVTPSETGYDAKFSKKVGAVTGTPAEQAEARANTYKEWTAAIQQDIDTKKQELKETGVPEEKKELKKAIKELEKKVAEKEKLQKKNQAEAEKLKKETPPSENVLAAHSVYEADFTNKMEESDTLTNPASKDSVKAVVYRNWASALQNDINTHKQNLDKITDPEKKKAEEQIIADLETERIGKQSAAMHLDQAMARKKGITPSTDKQGLPDTTQHATAFKSPEAATTEKQKNKLEWDAVVMNRKADSVAIVAASLSGEQKDAKQKEADVLKNQAREKEITAQETSLEAGTQEYSINRQKLKQYMAQPGASANPALTQAEALNDESKAYHDKSLRQRKEAEKSTSTYAREEGLKNAEESEKNSLESQEKSMALYASAYPGLKIKQPVPAKEDFVLPADKNPLVAAGTNTDTNPQPTLKEEEVKQSEPYKKALQLNKKMESDQLVVEQDNKNADEHQLHAQEYMREYKQLMKDTLSQPDATSKQAAIRKAKDFEALAEQHYLSADSARALAREKNKRITAAKADKEQLLASLDPSTRTQVETVLNKEANPVTPEKKETVVAVTPEKKETVVAVTPEKKETVVAVTPEKKETVVAVTPEKKETVVAVTPEKKETVVAVTPEKKETVVAVTPEKKETVVAVTPEKKETVVAVTPEKKETVVAVTPEKKETVVAVTPEKKETVVAVTPEKKETVVAVTPEKKETVAGVTPKEGTRANISETFMITAVESVSKEIPVDPKLPEGLLFKVQIGAFRHQISGEKFRGLNPLTAETTPQGFYRYTAGVFTHFEKADKAKGEIRAMGFNDAFVVAFYNGKRIPINDARAMVTGEAIVRDNNNRADNPSGTVAVNPVNPVNPTDAEPRHTSPASVQHDNILPSVSADNPGAIAKTTNVAGIQGLFYTVQVGVYSNPVSNEKLHGIQPLNMEKMNNGNLRYTTGQYSTPAAAAQAKAKMVALGVKDAFVVAYYNGKRMSVEEASRLNPSALPPVENTGNTTETPVVTPVHTNTGGNPVPSSNVVVTAPGDYSRFDNKEIEMAKGDTGVIYQVQIGAFREEVPLDIANKFLLLSKRGVKNFKDENSLTVFTVGHVRNYEDAQFLREEAIAKGISDAFILAYRDGKKISVAEARGTH